MRARHLLLPVAAGACLAWAACSPVDTRPERDETESTPGRDKIFVPDKDDAGGGDLLRHRIELAIKNVQQRELLTTHGFWTVFHGILGLGPRDTYLKDPATGQKYKAVDEYICAGKPIRGMIFVPKGDGLLDVETAGAPETLFIAQGHQDQFIAEMAQWGIKLKQPFRVMDKDYTFESFVRYSRARASLKGNQELSWTVLIIGQFYGTEYEWTNNAGEKLRMEDLLRYELDAPMEKAACGGTHRLFDLCWVHHLHLKRGGKTVGIWKRVADNTAHYQGLARKYQNADRSFSTRFFEGRDENPDPERDELDPQRKQRRINTTGHIFEWLSLSLTDKQLREPWVEDAANTLALMILKLGNDPMEGATLYHAVHGLKIYHARVFDRSRLAEDFAFLPLPPGEPAVAAK
jgi:hypothetical protein